MPALPFYPLLLAVLNLPALLIMAAWSRQKRIYPRIEMMHELICLGLFAFKMVNRTSVQ